MTRTVNCFFLLHIRCKVEVAVATQRREKHFSLSGRLALVDDSDDFSQGMRGLRRGNNSLSSGKEHSRGKAI
jgi:hypothetical protein